MKKLLFTTLFLIIIYLILQEVASIYYYKQAFDSGYSITNYYSFYINDVCDLFKN